MSESLATENAQLRERIAILESRLAERDEAIELLQRVVHDWKVTAHHFRVAALGRPAAAPAPALIAAAPVAPALVEFTHPSPGSLRALADELHRLHKVPPGMHDGYDVRGDAPVKFRFHHWLVQTERLGVSTLLVVHAGAKDGSALMFNSGNNGWFNWSPRRGERKQFMSGTTSVGSLSRAEHLSDDRIRAEGKSDFWAALCSVRNEVERQGTPEFPTLAVPALGVKGVVFRWTSMVVAALAENNMLVITNPTDVRKGSVWVCQPSSQPECYYCPGATESTLKLAPQ